MLAYILIILGVILRVVPHLPNMAPVTGLALFGGVYMKRSQTMWLPLAVMVISDAFLSPESLTTRLSVYGSFVLIGLIGIWLRTRKSVATILMSSIAGSIVFYLITNFAYFYPSDMYPHTLSGILASYYNGLPFFRNTLVGDLLYTGLLFGAYEFTQWVVRLRQRYAFDQIDTYQ